LLPVSGSEVSLSLSGLIDY